VSLSTAGSCPSDLADPPGIARFIDDLRNIGGGGIDGPQLDDQLGREALAAHLDGASVRLPGAMWLVSGAPPR